MKIGGRKNKKTHKVFAVYLLTTPSRCQSTAAHLQISQEIRYVLYYWVSDVKMKPASGWYLQTHSDLPVAASLAGLIWMLEVHETNLSHEIKKFILYRTYQSQCYKVLYSSGSWKGSVRKYNKKQPRIWRPEHSSKIKLCIIWNKNFSCGCKKHWSDWLDPTEMRVGSKELVKCSSWSNQSPCEELIRLLSTLWDLCTCQLSKHISSSTVFWERY